MNAQLDLNKNQLEILKLFSRELNDKDLKKLNKVSELKNNLIYN